MANTHEHLEQAEHAEHHASDPFNQRVAVSMAIVAAILAAISMVGHRTHNKVLQLQGESNRLLGEVNRILSDANRVSTEAANTEVEKANLFAWYQAKRQRQSVYLTNIEFAGILATNDKRDKTLAAWKKKADEYNDPKDPDSLPNIQKRGNETAEKAKGLRAEAAKIREQVSQLKQDATDRSNEAEHVHHQADRFDLAHLAAEFGLVLCSIALLTKKRGFWYTGLISTVVALALMASGYMVPHETHASHGSPELHETPSPESKPH